MLLRQHTGRGCRGLWSKSHTPKPYGKVCGMTLPPNPASDDRRTVPRHLRDSEHDMTGSAPGSGMRVGDAHDAGRRWRNWLYAGLLVALVGASLWLGLGAG
jgi:hypothetical protein